MDDPVQEKDGKMKIKLVALPCLCVDVFDGTNEMRPGGEALNFAAYASGFDEMDVILLGAVGRDMQIVLWHRSQIRESIPII